MIGPSTIPTVIDSDNALGEKQNKFLPGDVDDAFAIAFLLKSISVQALYSVGGNAMAEVCHQNNLALCKTLQSNVSCIQGLNKDRSVKHQELFIPKPCENYLSLGPLTNLSYFLEHNFSTSCLWMTLGRIKTLGLFPPLWPMEFNATKDLDAFKFVLGSTSKKIIVPLDTAIQLRYRKNLSVELRRTSVGRYLLDNIQSWQLRNRLLKARSHFPVWDLVSAIAFVHPETCQIERGTGHFFQGGLFLCDVLNRPQSFHDRRKAVLSIPIEIVTAIDSELMWKLFFKALQNP